jgi:hypothetical protein
VRRHDGFYFRFGLGAGYAIDRVTHDDYNGGVTLKGAAVATELAFGGTIGRVVLLGGIFNHVVPSLQGTFDYLGAPGKVDAGASILTLYGVGVDIYPVPTSGAHFGAAVGAMVLAMNQWGSGGSGGDAVSHSVNDGGSFGGAPPPPEPVSAPDMSVSERSAGLGMMLGGGYEWWIGAQWSLGIIGRVTAGRVEYSDYDGTHLQVIVIPAILGGVTYH